ncbi:hypothetical protein C0993_002203 [Termitomyces sp. T159_Od127]|nr:hypothetical protein C0993_002203 [Termitomyces sp. T159_Od127]
MSTFSNAHHAGNPGKITLPRLGPINEYQAPVKLSREGWKITHASASVPPELVLPRSIGEQNDNATAQIQLPPISSLIAEVDAQNNGSQRTIQISRPLLPGYESAKPTASLRVVIECQSLVSRDLPGFPLYEIRNWSTVRPAFHIHNGITEFEVQRRLASVHPPVIGFYLAGYNHLNLAVLLGTHNKCRTISDLVLHVGTICESFVVDHCDDYQGPRGSRVGPGYMPFECVRMMRVVQVTDSYWIGVLAVVARLKYVPQP